jgi:hypothetical protein
MCRGLTGFLLVALLLVAGACVKLTSESPGCHARASSDGGTGGPGGSVGGEGAEGGPGAVGGKASAESGCTPGKQSAE